MIHNISQTTISFKMAYLLGLGKRNQQEIRCAHHRPIASALF